MRSIKYLALMTAFAFILSTAAFAKNDHSGSFDLGQRARIGSTVLAPGHYKAEWTGPNTALHVTIMRDGKTVASTQAKLKELPSKSEYSAVTVKTLRDKSKRVDEIDFSNRRDALVLAGS